MADSPTPEEALAEARAAVEKANAAALDASTSSELVLGRDDAVQTKKQLGAAYSTIATGRKAAMEKVATAKEVIEAKRRELDALQRQLAAELEPLARQLERLGDGIKAVNLYLGTDEELVEVRGGESAPAETPLVIRQTVLAMDEEGAFYTVVEGEEFDYRDVDEFLSWLTSSEKHLDQVIPDAKGVVAIMPRRTPVDYDLDAMSAGQKNQANRHTYWLLRNGERLYLLDTEFSVGNHVIPTRRSFTQLFEDGRGNALEPGSREWLKAEETADKVTRHYMKVALILQGLVDRTAVFHPLPGGGLNLISNDAYDDGRVVLIEDEEKAIGTGRQPFKEWLRERCARLEVGQRVVGFWPAGEGRSDYRESFVQPQHASSPQAEKVHTIHRQDPRHWFFAYERSDTIDAYDNWGNYRGQRKPERRATYRIPKAAGSRVTFVPIDNVTVAEMQDYLDARTERHNYQSMFPALKAAIDFKLAEEAAEAPFRALLAAALELDNAEAHELVAWWKTANKWHRPLNGDAAFEARAVKAITAEHRRRGKEVPAAGIAALRSVEGAMVIASRTNDLLAVVPEIRAYSAASVPSDIYVAVHTFTPHGKPVSVKRWQTLTRAQVAKWSVIEQSEAWSGWTLNVAPGTHLPDPAIEQLVDELRAWAEDAGHGVVTAIRYEERKGLSGGHADVFWASRLDDRDDLEQPFMSVYVDISGGAGTFKRSEQTWLQSRDWRLEVQRTDSDRAAEEAGEFLASLRRSGAEIPVPPSSISYYGEGHPSSVVYRNAEAIEDDYRLAAGWADRVRARRAVQGAESAVESKLHSAWKANDEEIRRARFIDDFGDPALWEDHSKSQKTTPFPVERFHGRSEESKALSAFTKAVVREGVLVDGKTVAEVIAELSARVDGLPEALLSVRFPESKES